MNINHYASDFARSLPVDYKPGGLAALCQPIIDGYAAEKSGMDDDMLPHLVALGDQAEGIQGMERNLFCAQAALRVVLHAFDNHGNRNPERNPIQSAALRGVYGALGLRWPVEG